MANSRYCPFNIAEVGLNRVAINPGQFVKYCTLAVFFCELHTSMYRKNEIVALVK
jgi:hypothetical protein